MLAHLLLLAALPLQSEAAPPPEAVARRWRPVLEALAERADAGVAFALDLPDGRRWALGAGRVGPGEGTPLPADARFLAGSVGKTLVTAVAHALVLEGALELDVTLAESFADASPAPEWLARVPNADRVTLRQLLRHQSGMPRYVFQPAFFPDLLAAPDRVWRPEELLAYVHDLPPLFAPGEGFAYADTNYLLVGLLIERASGRRFYDLARERLLEPLGLADTLPSDGRRLPGVVPGHVVTSRSMGFAEWTQDDGVFVYNPQFEWCGGGYASTPADLARWARLLYSGRALDGPYLDTLLDAVDAPQLGPGTRYGLGVMLRATDLGPLRGHDGFMPGYLSTMGLFVDLDVGAALQLATDDSRAVGRPLHDLLVELVSAARDALPAPAGAAR